MLMLSETIADHLRTSNIFFTLHHLANKGFDSEENWMKQR